MLQQQQNSDSWTNSNQSSCDGENALAVARARTDVLDLAALIIRASALLDEAMAAPATPVRLYLIELARSRKMATTLTVTLTPLPSP